MPDPDLSPLKAIFKPAAVIGLALVVMGGIGGWAAASLAGRMDRQFAEVKAAIHDTQRELCAMRQATNVQGYTVICDPSRAPLLNHTGYTLAGVTPVAMEMVDDQVVSSGALITILAALSAFLVVLGALGFLLIWWELEKLRVMKHDLPNLKAQLTALCELILDWSQHPDPSKVADIRDAVLRRMDQS